MYRCATIDSIDRSFTRTSLALDDRSRRMASGDYSFINKKCPTDGISVSLNVANALSIQSINCKRVLLNLNTSSVFRYLNKVFVLFRGASGTANNSIVGWLVGWLVVGWYRVVIDHAVRRTAAELLVIAK